jgi:hypothetical protein
MKGLDIQDRLQCASSAVAVLRTLKIRDSTMPYKDFANAIGLIPDGGRWEPWHRQQVTDILNLVAAAERQGHANGDTEPLEFDRIVNADTGKPGPGIDKSSRIVRQ